MEIDNIFAIVKHSLIAVKYSHHHIDEFERLFDNWTDVEYLYDFFEEHERDLKQPFYGTISIEEAVGKTIDAAAELEAKLLELAELGKTDRYEQLQTLFKPLDDRDYYLRIFQKSKASGSEYKSWLRIYAIRIASNVFVVSGGAIKLTHKMEEREHLRLELRKLEITKQYLEDNDLLDKTDFEYLEIK